MTSTTSAPGSPQEAVEVRTENLFQRTEVLAGMYHNRSQQTLNLLIFGKLLEYKETSTCSINIPACVYIFGHWLGGTAAFPCADMMRDISKKQSHILRGVLICSFKVDNKMIPFCLSGTHEVPAQRV